jgi:hypothetical protein
VGFLIAFCTHARSLGKGGSETTTAASSAVANLLGLKVSVESGRDFLFAKPVEPAGLVDLERLTIAFPVVVKSNLNMRITL